ncbi:unnamed protein product [Heligmosomoides polygyrus]|uniref:Uncharacterized protein n=1 Tax=Heligmosomoides polygyrus TaxID=6339 RepID=A0A3P7U5G1_HELPZ|nr:unnamed protein product [Heligmosomoides polygyrus]
MSEGVRSAEMALKLRQQAEREERRLRLMRQEQDRVNSEIADLQGRSITSNGDVRRGTMSSTRSDPQELPRIEEEVATPAPQPKPKTPPSESPSVADTQSPAADSPHLSMSHMSSEVFLAPTTSDPAPAPLPPPPPPKPARNQVAPLNGSSHPRPAPRTLPPLSGDGSKQPTVTFEPRGTYKHYFPNTFLFIIQGAVQLG